MASSGQLATDGLWARLRGKSKKVVLLVADRVSGLIWPPVGAAGEEAAAERKRLFERAKQAGLRLETVRGLTRDGAKTSSQPRKGANAPDTIDIPVSVPSPWPGCLPTACPTSMP